MKNRNTRVSLQRIYGFCFCFLAACAPKVYVMDRHTVMEEESAGDWPQFDQISIEELAQPGTTPLASDPEQEKQSENRKILNGEAVKEAQ
jgi:hypothetical protein